MTSLPTLIEHLRELEKRATPGPWEYYISEVINNEGLKVCAIGSKDFWESDFTLAEDTAHSELIMAMRNSLPLLLDALEIQRKALEEMTEDKDDGGAEGWYGTKAYEAISKCDALVQAKGKE